MVWGYKRKGIDDAFDRWFPGDPNSLSETCGGLYLAQMADMACVWGGIEGYICEYY